MIALRTCHTPDMDEKKMQGSSRKSLMEAGYTFDHVADRGQSSLYLIPIYSRLPCAGYAVDS